MGKWMQTRLKDLSQSNPVLWISNLSTSPSPTICYPFASALKKLGRARIEQGESMISVVDTFTYWERQALMAILREEYEPPYQRHWQYLTVYMLYALSIGTPYPVIDPDRVALIDEVLKSHAEWLTGEFHGSLFMEPYYLPAPQPQE